jgi:preprotein translocase subunit SecD
MNRRNLLVLLSIIVIFILSLLTVLPIDKGVLGGKGILLGLDLQGGIHIVYKADLSDVEEGKEGEIIDGVVAVIANRINPLGVTEPVIGKQGNDRIVVELPGFDITDVQKERIGRTALLEFRERVIEDG